VTACESLRNGPILLDLTSHQLFVEGEFVKLTPKEYRLLELFVMNRGKTIPHEQILREVWGLSHIDDIQYLRVYLCQIRMKLAKWPAVARCITSESRVGYRMEILEDDTPPEPEP